MKQLLPKFFLLTALLSLNVFYAQKKFSMNAGGTGQKKYFTTIPYKELKNKVIIQSYINGKPYNFIIDTGAATTITPALYKELNSQVINHVPVSDQSGIVDSLQIVSLKNIQLGDVTFNDIPAMVVKETMLFDCFKVDGLIGSNMLRNSIVQFASQTHTLTITDKPKSLNLKGRYATKMVTDKIQSNPFLAVEVMNSELHLTDNLLFDSGMDSFYDLSFKAFNEISANRNLLQVEAQAVGSYSLGLHGLSAEEESYRVFAPELKISGYTFKNVTTVTTHGHSSRIGADLFKYGVVTLDYINRKFYFEPYQEEAKDLTEKSWPFIPTVKDGKIVIGLIWDQAWEGKINQNDLVISFNGKNYENADVCDVMTADNRSKNDTATLVLKDAKTGEVKTFEVTR
jgi:predicted aspartyl protease